MNISSRRLILVLGILGCCSLAGMIFLVLKHRSSAEGYYDRGHAQWKKKNFEKAVEHFTKAIELKPDYAEAYRHRGVTRDDSGDFTGAVADLTRAVELQPDFALAYGNRCYAHFKQDDYEKAHEDLERARAVDPHFNHLWVPNFREAYHGRALARTKNGDLAGAGKDWDRLIEICTKAIEKQPDDLGAFFLRGMAWEAKNEPGRAVADFDAVLKLDPDNFEAESRREIVLEKMKKDAASSKER